MTAEAAHIAIAGAGIGGLAAAIACARAGQRVSLFERAERAGEVGAGLQLSPNACRILRRWELLEPIAADAVEPEALMMRRGLDGAVLARLPLGETARRRFGAPFLVIHRADLHRRLLAAAESLPGVEIHRGRAVEDWTTTARGLDLVFAAHESDAPRDSYRPDDRGPQPSGHVARAIDGLVGADGVHSTVARRLGLAAPVHSGRLAWRGVVDAAAVPALARKPHTNLWLGPDAHLVHYPLRGGSLVNVVAIVADAARGSAEAGPRPDFWARPGDQARLARRFAGWAAPVRDLLAAVPEWRVWPLLDRADAPAARRSSSTDTTSRARAVTLLGDAAHPMLPFLAQGAAQSIEDAAALAEAIGAGSGDLSAAFDQYTMMRSNRTRRVQAASRRQATVYHLSSVPAMMRDLALRSLGPERLLARYDWLYADRR